MQKLTILLLALILLLAGCAGPEDMNLSRALNAVNTTIEGRIANNLHEKLIKTENCTVLECKRVLTTIEPYLSGELRRILEYDNEQIRQIIEQSKECNPRTTREVEKPAEYRYRFTYRIEITEECKIEEFKRAAQTYHTEIEVDLAENTVRVLKGKLDVEAAKEAEESMLVFLIIGNCTAPVAAMFGFEFFSPTGVESATSPSPAASPPAHTPTPGHTPMITPTTTPTLPPTTTPAPTLPPTVTPTTTSGPVPTATPSPVPTRTPVLGPEPGTGSASQAEFSLWAEEMELAVFAEMDNPNASLELDSGVKTVTLKYGLVSDPVFHEWFGGEKQVPRDGYILLAEPDGTVNGKWTFSGATVESVLSGNYYIHEAKIALQFIEKAS